MKLQKETKREKDSFVHLFKSSKFSFHPDIIGFNGGLKVMIQNNFLRNKRQPHKPIENKSYWKVSLGNFPKNHK